MRYLILTKIEVEYAENISKEIWNIRYPQIIRKGNETTSMYCGFIKNDDASKIALAFPNDVLKVHPQSSYQPLVNLITQGLSEQQITDVQNHFDSLWASLGTEQAPILTIENVLPPLFSENLKTKQELIDLEIGFFNPMSV